MSEILPDKIDQPVSSVVTDGWDPTPRPTGIPERRHFNPNQVPMSTGHIALTANQMQAPTPSSLH